MTEKYRYSEWRELLAEYEFGTFALRFNEDSDKPSEFLFCR